MKTAVEQKPPRSTRSTLRYRPKFSSVLYVVLVGMLFVAAGVARFHLPQTPFIDGDFMGYLNPALSALTGHGFRHTDGRDTLYPGFIFAVLKCAGSFRAIAVVQHLVGLATGILMLMAYRRGSHLVRHPHSSSMGVAAFFGLLPAAAYLTAPSAIYFEHCIRPEAVFPFFVVLSIWLNLEFIHRRWIAPAMASAAWLGAAQMVVSLIAYKLKPSFGFAVIFTNLPLLAALLARGMSVRTKALMVGGGGIFCALFLMLPESLLKRSDLTASLFLPDTLMTIHADLIRDQIAEDVAAIRPSPFPPETVKALLDRLDVTLPLSRKPENNPYGSLGFNPDYLLYTDCVYNGVTRGRRGLALREALGFYYYKRTFLHHPLRMFDKIWRQLEIFYDFGTASQEPMFTNNFHMRGTRMLSLEKDYQRNVDLGKSPRATESMTGYPPASTYLEISKKLTSQAISIEQKPILTIAQKTLELLYFPTLLAALLITGWVVWTGRLHTSWVCPVAVTLLIASYNFGNNLTIATVHSLDVSRYIDNELSYTLLAATFTIFFVCETVKRLATGLAAPSTNPMFSQPWSAASAPAPALSMRSAESLPPSLCVLIPCYNEATSIAAVVAEYREAFPAARLLVVDNASTDGTAAAAAAAGADVLYEPGKGKARAILTALTNIDSDLVLMVDGDGSYPAEGGRRLFESYLAQPADLITGVRNPEESADGSFRPLHQGGTHLFGRILGMVFGWNAADLFSGLRLFSRRFYENVPILSRGFELELELTVQAIDKGFAMRDLPVPFGLRAEGTQSKLRTIQDGSRILRLLFVLFRDYRPLLCFSSMAGVFFLLSLLAGFAPIRDYVVTRYVTHLPLAVLAASLMVLAFLTLQTGLVLESGLRYNRETTQLRLRDSARKARK